MASDSTRTVGLSALDPALGLGILQKHLRERPRSKVRLEDGQVGQVKSGGVSLVEFK